MTMHPVQSSNVAEIGYEGGRMRVTFRSGGTYEAGDVPEHEFAAWKAHTSKGRHYAKHLAKTYIFRKVDA